MSMNKYPPELKYNPEHSWLKLEGDNLGRVGITFFAQEQLKKVVFIELPEVGTKVEHMVPFGVIESVKAINDLYSPVTGEVVEVNTAIIDEPQVVNQDPYGAAWMIVVKISRMEEIDNLISAEEYQSLVQR